MVSEPTLAVSRHIRAEVRGHEHGRVVADATGMWTGACGRRCAGIEDALALDTDVAQGPLTLDARTWHMGPLALDVWDVAKRGDPGGI